MLTKETIEFILRILSSESYVYEMIESPNKIYFIKYHRSIMDRIMKNVTGHNSEEEIKRIKVAHSILVTQASKAQLEETNIEAFRQDIFKQYLKQLVK